MWIRLYDPTRTPAHWLEIIRPGQFCVFLLTASARAPKDANGQGFAPGEDSVQVAVNLPEALCFAEEIVSRHPQLCAEIYNHQGKTDEPIRTIYNPSERGKYEGADLAKRLLFIGLAVLSVAAPFIIYDAKRGLRWMWGYIIGLKLFIIGGTFVIRGIVALLELRRSATPPAGN
jgi:hypothetical protein